MDFRNSPIICIEHFIGRTNVVPLHKNDILDNRKNRNVYKLGEMPQILSIWGALV